MDLKSIEHPRHKRKTRGAVPLSSAGSGGPADEEIDDKWECSVCTYINRSESYKCEMCFMRKGTSTRKPRLNSQLVEQQQLIAQTILKEKDDDHRKKRPDRNLDNRLGPNGNSLKLKHYDRSSPLLFKIFANGYSVVITEFPLKSKLKLPGFPDSPAPSSCSSLQGFSGTPLANPEQLSPTDSTSNSDVNYRIMPYGDYELGTETADTKPQPYSHPSSALPVSSKSADTVHHPTRSRLPTTDATIGTSHRSPRSTTSFLHSNHSTTTAVKCEEGTLRAELVAPRDENGVDGRREEDSKPSLLGATRALSRLHNPSESSATRLTGSQPGVAQLPPLRLSKKLLRKKFTTPLSSRSRSRRRASQMDSTSRTSTATSVKRRKLNAPYKSVVTKTPSSCSRRISQNHRRSYKRRSGLAVGRAKSSDEVSYTASTCKRRSSTKPQPLRITVSRVSTDTETEFVSTSHVSTEPPSLLISTPKQRKSKSRRSSSGRSELKCKIRVVRSNSDHRVESGGVDPMDYTTSLTTGNENAHPSSPDLMNTSDLLTLTVHPRLSTESKNTSAMTDSSGATALEISR